VLIQPFRHLMTGTGAYFYITWGIWLRHCLNGRQEEYDLRWPSLFSLPEVVKRNQVNGGLQQDSAKKKKIGRPLSSPR
jgi:dihydroceramidase